MESQKPEIIVIPFPQQGHINPMLQLSKRLASKGLSVTLFFTITTFITKSTHNTQNTQDQDTISSGIRIKYIPDGFSQDEKPWSFEDFLQRFEATTSRSLAEFIEKQQRGSSSPVKAIMYDSSMPWVLDVAHRYGVRAASFFTQACAVSAIYYNLRQGALKVPDQEVERSKVSVLLPSMPPLKINDMPSFVFDTSIHSQGILEVLLRQFSNIQAVDWLLFNTFHSLEDEVVNWMASQWSIKTIGPTIPSMYLDKRLQDDRDYGLSLFKPNTEACMNWLDSKEIGSVVYVSFGSVADMGKDQIEEIALGLMRSNQYFLWVVRASEESKLPSSFRDANSEKGLVLNWCPQLKVLAHGAVGCFITHCGWNSTIEALSLGVPLVAMPFWSDQPTNAKFIEDVWQVGVRVKADDKGIVTEEEIDKCIKQVTGGQRGIELKRNAVKWKELAREAVDEGGTSDKNIEDFVSALTGT